MTPQSGMSRIIYQAAIYLTILLESDSANEVDQSPLLHRSQGHRNEAECPHVTLTKNRPTAENAHPAERQLHHSSRGRNDHVTHTNGNADKRHERSRFNHTQVRSQRGNTDDEHNV